MKKELKNQKKVLTEIKSELNDLKNKPNVHAELVIFLTDNFDVILKECLSYLKLFHELTKKCANLFNNNERSIDYLIALQKQNTTDCNERFNLIIKKVFTCIKTNSVKM